MPGGPVWYRVAGKGDGIPLLALHGGPGGTSCSLAYLEVMPGVAHASLSRAPEVYRRFLSQFLESVEVALARGTR